jgi:hypothetical protein
MKLTGRGGMQELSGQGEEACRNEADRKRRHAGMKLTGRERKQEVKLTGSMQE